MRVTALLLVIVAGASQGSARLRNPISRDAMETVQVCSDNTSENTTNFRARSLVTGMFADIGVGIGWHRPESCPAGAIRIGYSTSTAGNLMPGALAFALPYDGTHIVVFYDRVRATVPGQDLFPALLAHVMAHEITHILEGTARHSAQGLMKAHWTPADYCRMRWKSLPFAAEDVELIRRGLEERAARRAAEPSGASVLSGGE